MASTSSLIAAQILPTHTSPPKPHTPVSSLLPTRRQFSLLLTAILPLTAAVSAPPPSKAQDIPLFGLRKNLRKAEQEAELIVKEGFEAADKGIVAAEQGIVAAEKGIEGAGKEIEIAAVSVSFGGLAQAGAVVGAEVVAVVVASSVVNGILGPEPAQKS